MRNVIFNIVIYVLVPVVLIWGVMYYSWKGYNSYRINHYGQDAVAVITRIDTLLSHSWKEIRNGYKILVRYDLSAEDLESLKGKIYYPPTTAMRNIHMFPPYEKVKVR